MEQLTAWLSRAAQWTGQFGVPEEYQNLVALAGFFLLVTLFALLLIVLLLRRRRPSQKAVAEEAPAGPVADDEGAVAETEEEVAQSDRAPAASAPEGTEESTSGEVAVSAPVAEAPQSVFDRMRRGLAKTQASLIGRLDALLGGQVKIDSEMLEELEEILITADLGMKTTRELIEAVEQRLARDEVKDPAQVRDLLRREIAARLQVCSSPLEFDRAKPFVMMVVGVNGVGKTTTIGKLARRFHDADKKVVLGAGDTFRAAAAEQLAIWGERAGVEVIRHQEGADPAAVAYDAARAAVARKADLLILDTAGRLHTKVNLMEELKKVRRVLDREIPGAPHETLLVLDATTGQNALAQARLFSEAVEVSGIALTKLDGTARGGIVVAIAADLKLPVRFVGVGEKVEDLRPFEPEMFVAALFETSEIS